MTSWFLYRKNSKLLNILFCHKAPSGFSVEYVKKYKSKKKKNI